jgi:hypothetical protein
MIPAFEHHPNCQFLGFPMSQNRYAIPAWSYLFEKVKPVSIVEIGTSDGGMSCLLAIAALRLRATFDTFDVGATVSDEIRAILDEVCVPGNGFHQHDVFEVYAQGLIKHRVARPGSAIILCDGGNKDKEFRTFLTFLKHGDIIATHDARGRESWPWQEFFPENVQDIMQKNDLEEFMREVFMETGWFVCRKIVKSEKGS